MKNFKFKKWLKRPSTWIGCVILLGWVATMGMLLKDYNHTGDIPALDPDSSDFFGSVQALERWNDIEEWMEIVQVNPETGDTRTVGASRTTIVLLDDATTAAAYRGEFVISAKLSPLLPQGTIAGSAILDRFGSLTEFGVRGQVANLKLSSQGVIANNLLYVYIDNMNEISRMKKRLDQPVTFGEMLRPSLARHMKLEPGERMSSPIVDPLTGQHRGSLRMEILQREAIILNGRRTSALRVKSSVGDIETLMWVDEEGRTLRRNLVNNLRMDRVDKESALEIIPTLADEVDFPPLDLTEFRDVPVDSGEANTTPGTGQMGFLNFFLR